MAGRTIDVKLRVQGDGSEKRALSTMQQMNKEKEKLENREYGVARSAVGTGAAGRDFAKQAEGLGGFVRVYATFAANAFAAQAAFTALSNAMDTTNMVKGMDQLGAASGMALGSLAKRLADTTDGAVSLREAMEATTKATAAGMTSKQLLQLGEVAKKAGAALGVSVPDALSRLSRGITKLEPELLDELGIFAKIEPAVNDYARALGKSAGSLTDFERRQAYTLAVLSEGITKFGEIDLPANPYNKLLASMKDITQTGLEVINKVLAPIAKLMAESPTALSAALIAIVGTLIRKAIPAVAQLRQSLQLAQQESASKAYGGLEEMTAGRREVALKANAAAIIAAKKAAEEVADVKLQQVDVFASEVKAQKKRPPKFIREMASLQSPADLSPEIIEGWKQQLPSVQNSPKLKALAERGIQANEEWLKAEQDLKKKINEEEEKYIKLQERSLAFKREKLLAERELQKYVRDTIVLESEQTGRRQGFGEAWRQMNEEIRRRRAGPTEIDIPTGRKIKGPDGIDIDEMTKAQVPKMGALGAGITRVRVGFMALTSAISSTLSVLGPWIQILTLIAPILGLLHDKLLGNSEDIERTKKSYDAFTDSVKAANNTVEYLGKNSDRIFSISNINAAGTAFMELGNNFYDFVTKANKELSSGSAYYKFIEGIQNIFGGGTRGDIKNTTISAVETALKLAGPEAEALKGTLAEIVGLDASTSVESLMRAVKEAPVEKSKELAAAILKSGTNAKASSQAIVDLNNNLKEATKTFDNLANSLLPNSGIAKWAMDGFKNMQDFNKSIGKSAKDIGALNDLLANPENIVKQFGPDAFNAIQPLIPQVQQLSKEYTKVANSIDDIDKKDLKAARENIAKIQENLADAVKKGQDGAIQYYTNRLENAKKGIETFKKESPIYQSLVEERDKIEKEIDSIFKSFRQVSADSAKYFGEVLASEVSAGYARGALAVRKTAASYIEDPTAKAREEAGIARKDIDIQSDQIRKTVDLIKQMELSRISIDENTAVTKLRTVQESTRFKEGEAGYISSKDQERMTRDAIATILSADQRRNLIQDPKKQRQVFGDLQEQAKPGSTATEIEREAALQTLNSSTRVALQQIASGESKLAELGGARKAADVKETLEIFKGETRKEIETLQAQSEKLQAQKQAVVAAQATSTQTEVEKLREVASYDKQILDTNNAIKNVQLESALTIAKILQALYPTEKIYADNVKYSQQQLDRFKEVKPIQEANAQSERDRKESLAIIVERYAAINRELEFTQNLLQSSRKLEDANTNAEKSRFDTLASMGRYTEQEIQDKNTLFTIEQARRDEARQLQDIQDKLAAARTRMQEAAAKNDPGLDKARDDYLKLSASVDADTQAVKVNSQARIENARLIGSVSVEQKKFTDFATRSFESMGDALADFAMTGKLNFKSLVDSMISDFIRMIMRMNMQKLAGGTGGQDGLANLLGSGLAKLFRIGGTNPYDVNAANTGLFGGADIGGVGASPYAKGAMFADGIEKFAKGGMFTNSIVNSPTLFKFAKGTGLMGEAGPEAIMPLTRDSTGRLGVQAQGTQSNVDIVVNNYTGQQATTQETTDARGNRRIEVVVGDMTASEMVRPGSSTQNAMRAGFGLQPMLTRR